MAGGRSTAVGAHAMPRTHPRPAPGLRSTRSMATAAHLGWMRSREGWSGTDEASVAAPISPGAAELSRLRAWRAMSGA
jgi:hypothetical protein